jgi:hypothetical protein
MAWFFAEVDGVADMAHGRLLQHRLESVVALSHALTESLSGALEAASAGAASERVEAFFAALRRAHAKLEESVAGRDS